MEYSKIIAITGLPGLFELISSKSDGGIVRSLDDKSTRFVSSRVHQFSHLESIEVYTTRHNVNLVEVLKAMENGKEKLPDDKDPAGLKSYFEKVFPELDFERVYSSDLKKMVKWFSALVKNQVDIKLSEPPASEDDEAKEEEIAEKEGPVKKEAKSGGEKTTVKKIAQQKPAEAKPAAKTAESKAKELKPAKKSAGKKEPAQDKTLDKTVQKKSAQAPSKETKKSGAKPVAKKPAAKKK
jgi:hypothetical protein